MSLAILHPPEGAVAEIARHLAAKRAARHAPGNDPLHDALRGRVRLAAPHPLFNLAPADVQAGGCVERARMTGWGYWLLGPREVVGRVELSAAAPDAAPRFALVSSGRLALALALALHDAEASSAMRRGAYVLGLLRVPELHAHALWLRAVARPGVGDLFVPVDPAGATIAPTRPVHLDAAMAQLVRAKDRRLARARAPSHTPAP